MKENLRSIEELDVVALLSDHTDSGLVIGQVGTVVEILGPKTVEVEFVTSEGETYAQIVLSVEELLVLHYSPVAA